MSKTRGSNLPWEARAAEVLAGRMRIDAAALIGLVNEVNPTGRGRDGKESAARYALKARLESLLVSHFPDDIEVAPDPEHEGLVSLRHRTQRAVACHAIVDALGDDARSWIRLQLDLGAAEPESDPRPARTGRAAPTARPSATEALDASDPEVLRRAALQAEEEFDFELATQLYTRAFDVGRDARSAQALLRFLVDAMAADADALALEAKLPTAARAHPGVRVLLGIAAARSGDDARSLAYVADLHDPRAAEALALVARSALTRGDTRAAALRLAEAEALAPASPELRVLADDLAARTQAERAPHEAALADLLAAGRDAEATAQCEAILARWPGSDAAQRAARLLSAKRQTAEARRLLDEADAARARGERSVALALAQRVLAAHVDEETRTRAHRAAAALDAEEREHEATLQAQQVAAAVGEQDRHERTRGLAAFADLDEALRARVQARATVPALDWIDTMLRAGCRPRAATEAALALERAEALPAGDPVAVLALLASHERALEAVAAARRLEARAREAAAEARRRLAHEALDAAENALAAGDADQTARLLDQAARDLGPTDAARPRVEALRVRLAALIERRSLERRFERARTAHHYAGARLCADTLVSTTEGADRARWVETARAYADGLAQEQRVRVFAEGGGADCARGSYLSDYPPAIATCVDLRAGLVLLPAVAGHHVFVRSFALDTGRLVRTVHVLAPERLDEAKLELSGDSVLIHGGSNGILELSRASGQPLRWVGLRDPRTMDRRFSDAVLPVPGGRYLWVRHDGDMYECAVYDIEGERPVRALPEAERFHALPGLAPPQVALARAPGEEGGIVLSLHEPAGVRTARYEFPHDVWSVVPHPVGDGLIVAHRRSVPALEKPGAEKKESLAWVDLSPQGEHRSTGIIPNAHDYPRVALARARDLGMIFLTLIEADGTTSALLALAVEPASGTLELAWRLRLGPRRILVQDQEGRRAFVVGQHDGGVEVIALGREAPVLPDRGPAHAMKLPLLQLATCTQPGGERQQAALTLFVKQHKWKRAPEVQSNALALVAARAGDFTALVELFWSLTLSESSAAAGALADELRERYPGHPEVVQAGWAALAVQRKWQSLIAALDPLDPTSLTGEGEQKHRHHLLAAAHLAAGDVDRAAQHLEEAKALTGKCDLAPLLALTEALVGEAPTEPIAADLPSLRQLLALIRAADARLAAGDHAGVIALFDRSLTWELDEVQSFARLAVAHLATPARTEQERLLKSLVLSRFAELLYEGRVGFRREVLVPRATWTTEQLDAIGVKADAWLDAEPAPATT